MDLVSNSKLRKCDLSKTKTSRTSLGSLTGQSYNETYNDGVELDNLKLYFRGVMLTLFYILMTPVLSSVISLILAFFSPLASILSFVLILILRFVIRMRRTSKDKLNDLELTDDEKELLENIRESIYGDDS